MEDRFQVEMESSSGGDLPYVAETAAQIPRQDLPPLFELPPQPLLERNVPCHRTVPTASTATSPRPRLPVHRAPLRRRDSNGSFTKGPASSLDGVWLTRETRAPAPRRNAWLDRFLAAGPSRHLFSTNAQRALASPRTPSNAPARLCPSPCAKPACTRDGRGAWLLPCLRTLWPSGMYLLRKPAVHGKG
jgi:hypothetical protein